MFVAVAREKAEEALQQSLWWWVALAVAIMLAVGLIVWVKSRFRDHEDAEAAGRLLFSQLREMHQEGRLSDEEFRSIKRRLVERLDDSVRAPENNGSADSSAVSPESHDSDNHVV